MRAGVEVMTVEMQFGGDGSVFLPREVQMTQAVNDLRRMFELLCKLRMPRGK